MPDSITYLSASSVPDTLDLKARTIEFIITTARQDRQGDIVEPAGMDVEEYLQNPVFQWAHDLESPPIGKTLSVTVEKDHIRVKVEFAKTKTADEIFQLYAGGFLRCVSIGFQIKKFKWIQAEEDALVNQPGPMASQVAVNPSTQPAENPVITVVRRGLHILEALLVEISAVPVPANPDAMCRGLALVQTKSLRESLCKAAGIAEPGPAETGTSPLVVSSPDGKEFVPAEFVKSLTERGAQGKIPCRVVLVEKAASDCSTLVDWSTVQKDKDGHVTEAKILGIVLELPRPEKKALDQEPPPVGTPTGPSRQEAPSATPVVTLSVEQIDAEIASAQTKALAFAKSLLELEGALA